MSYKQAMKQFEEIDAYMAKALREIADAQPDDRLANEVLARVREDGYPQFADALAEAVK